MNSAATQRIIALVDMDCFYCQVEARLNPELQGKPVAVVQYNQWKGGGIIAVNYEARDRGVTRYMRGDEAKEICPEINLVSVPTIRGKADLTKYRDAGDEVAKVFSEFSECVQRASIDEAFLDLTKAIDNYIKTHTEELNLDLLPNTFVVGYCDLKSRSEEERVKGLKNWLSLADDQKVIARADYHLAIGGIIVEKMRAQIFEKTGFHCSAGIAHNKILAKLTAGLHKPKKQTILPHDSVPELYETLPVRKVRNLGGKLGKLVMEKLSITYMSELHRFSLPELQRKFDEKTGNWLYNIARGIDLEAVTSRLCSESIGCCKNFPGKNMLTKKSAVEHWLKELATELSLRLFKDLEKNKRRAKLLTVSFCQESAMTRCGSLNSYEINKIVSDAMDLIKKFNMAPSSEDLWNPPIKYLGLSASKFVEESTSIERFLKSRVNGNQISSEVNSFFSTKQPTMNGETSNSADCKTLYSIKPSKSSKVQSKSSFFIKFLNTKKVDDESVKLEKEEDEKDSVSAGFTLSEILPDATEAEPEIIDEIAAEATKLEDKEDEKDSDKAHISLSEIFPDITEAEPEIVELLPNSLQKKFRERLNTNGEISKVKDIDNQNDMKEPDAMEVEENSTENYVETEVCSECKKHIPLIDFLEHLDYHAAYKLHSEINNAANNSTKINLTKVKEPDSCSKRKKGGITTPSKKMKSITSFFTVLPK